MKKYFVKLLFASQLLSTILLGQNIGLNQYISTEPIGGWDSIKSKIMYSELLRRVGFWSIYVIDFSFDSLGNVEKFAPTKFLHFDRELNVRTIEGSEKVDSSMVMNIETIIKSVKWKPVVYDSERIKGRAKIPIIFNLYGFSKLGDGVIINVPLPLVKGVY